MSVPVTIILPAYNAEATLGHAVKSVLAQSYADWRLVIIDDGSTDRTAELAAEMAATDPRITLLRQENAGVAAARNAGIAAAETDLLAFLDADDAYGPDYLAKMAGVMAAEPDLALLCCDAWTFREEGAPLRKCSDDYGMVPPVTLERVLSRDFQIYAAAMVRKTWVEKAGGLDPDLRNAVDFDLWVRILLTGGRAAYFDEALCWYRIDQASSLSGTASRKRLRNNVLRVIDKAVAVRGDLSPIRDKVAAMLSYRTALEEAKLALNEKRMADFQAEAKTALRLGSNPKLRIALLVSQVSPALAHRLFAGR